MLTAAMAPAVRTNRGAENRDCLLFFLTLLCLAYGVNIMSNKEKQEALRKGIIESLKIREDEKKNDAIMSKLMQATASLVNKDQLKTLKNELQQMGKEANRRQVEKLDRIEAAVKDFDETMKKLNSPQKQANQEKAESEALLKMMKRVEDLFKKLKRVSDRMGLSGGEFEDNLKIFQELLKLLKPY